MAWATVATIISDAALQLGLSPVAIADPYGSTDDNILRLCAALNQLGQDLLQDFHWSHLQKEATFNTANGTASYDLATDFQRFVNQTAWNRDQNQPLLGPVSPQKWQLLKGNGVSAYVGQAFRIWQNKIWLFPTPSSIEAMAYEYGSNLWVVATGGTVPTKVVPTVATDELWFDRALLTWGLRLYHRRDSGFPSDTEQDGFSRALARTQGSDGASPILSVTSYCDGPPMLGERNIPESGYGV